MKNIILVALLFSNVYAQGFECDNNFGDCGTPEQSGGGGGGKGSVLIANTDLGDTYQSADDYDGDGIEDPSDNCMRDYNPQQLDSDGDGSGDMCDNCIFVWNEYQENADGDDLGDFCDEDIDGDGILNSADECPYQWGNSFCFEELKQKQTVISEDQMYESPEIVIDSHREDSTHENTGCASISNKTISDIFLIIGMFLLFPSIISFNKKRNK